MMLKIPSQYESPCLWIIWLLPSSCIVRAPSHMMMHDKLGENVESL